MIGNQRSKLAGLSAVIRFHGHRHCGMQVGAPGLKLGVVGHFLNKGVAKRKATPLCDFAHQLQQIGLA